MMKSEGMMPEAQRRRYTDVVKMEAVRLARESNRPAAQVAWELGIADNLLYRWIAEHRQAEVQGHPCGPPHRSGGARAGETGTRTGYQGVGFFTTRGGVLREGVPMRYRAIHENDRRYPSWEALCMLSAVLEIRLSLLIRMAEELAPGTR